MDSVSLDNRYRPEIWISRLQIKLEGLRLYMLPTTFLVHWSLDLILDEFELAA